MSEQGSPDGGVYEGSIRDRLETVFLAVGGDVSRAVAHRYAILKILEEGSGADLDAYFKSDAFSNATEFKHYNSSIRNHEMRYAALTAVIGILSQDKERRDALLHTLTQDAPQETMARTFVSKLKYIGDNRFFVARLAESGAASEDHCEVLIRILEETSDASIDPRGKKKDVTRALEEIIYGGLSTMDSVLDQMYKCIDRDMIYFDQFFMSRTTQERRDEVHSIMTVSLHRVQAVAGMRHDLASQLLNTDKGHENEWVLMRRTDGQIVVTTKPLEAFLTKGTSGPIKSRLRMVHEQGDPRLKHTQGCPVMILPLFLESSRAMITRYVSQVT